MPLVYNKDPSLRIKKDHLRPVANLELAEKKVLREIKEKIRRVIKMKKRKSQRKK